MELNKLEICSEFKISKRKIKIIKSFKEAFLMGRNCNSWAHSINEFKIINDTLKFPLNLGLIKQIKVLENTEELEILYCPVIKK